MAPRRFRAAFLLTAVALAGLLAAPSAAAAMVEPVADSSAACPGTTLVRVCVESLDCIAIFVLGQPFAIIGCA